VFYVAFLFMFKSLTQWNGIIFENLNMLVNMLVKQFPYTMELENSVRV